MKRFAINVAALLLLAKFALNCWASIERALPWDGDVAAIEINVFGPPASERCAVIFRAENGDIIDWRWQAELAKARTDSLGDGWMISWTDRDGNPRTVFVKRLYKTRTLEDVEQKEREWLPEAMRRKLR